MCCVTELSVGGSMCMLVKDATALQFVSQNPESCMFAAGSCAKQHSTSKIVVVAYRLQPMQSAPCACMQGNCKRFRKLIATAYMKGGG